MSNWTEADVAAHLARLVCDGELPIPKPKARQPRTGYRSKLEARYAQHLELMVATREIKSWAYEAVTLKLAPGVRFIPDFMVTLFDGTPAGAVRFEELKGRKKTGFWTMPVSKIKIRLAAKLFPQWQFCVVFPNGRLSGWESQPVGRE